MVVDSAQSSKYRVLLELGQGGTAHVYLAVAHGPVGFNKLVVFKTLKASLGSDPQFRRMFLNEARLSARLNHPNIVQVNEVIENDGLPVIVMEYLQGKPLSELRARAGDGMSLGLHLRIISEALGGLHYSHELTDYDGTPLNVVHRDMTPHNVFVTYDGQVKILDFGIAKLSGSLVETQTGVIKGKLRYMPAEQIIGDKIDCRTDVFAVGVMIWEAATGTRMWGNLSEAAIMNRVLNGEILPPSSLKPDVDPELERIVMKALQYDPNQRYATAADLQADLDAFISRLGPALALREIGEFVTEYFEESRLQTLKIVEQQLNDASFSAESRTGESFSPPSLSHTRAAYSSTISVTRSMIAPVKWRAGALFAGALLLVVGGVAAWRLTAPATNGSSLASATSTRAVSAAQSVDHGTSEITLRVTAFPLTAEVTLDGKPLSGNPHVGTMAAVGGEHQIEASAPGYVTQKRAVDLSSDLEVVLSLEPDKDAQKAAMAPPSRASPATPARSPEPDVPAATHPKTDCNPPFFVDERGIKKFKPGCI